METFQVRGDRICGRSSFPAWLAAVRPHVEGLSIVVPTESGGHDGIGYTLQHTDRIFSLPRSEGFFRGYANIFFIVFALIRSRIGSKTVLCRSPEHLNLFILPVLFLLRYDVYIWVVHDREETVSSQRARRKGAWLALGLVLSKLTGDVENWAYGRARGVIVNGLSMTKKLSAAAGRTPLLSIVSSTISREHLPAEVPDRRFLTEGQTRIIYVGRLANEKGLSDLLMALSIIRDDDCDFHAQIVGWSSHGELERLQDEVRRLRLDSRVSFAGPLAFGPMLFSAYAEADIFVLPSWAEGTPRVLVEAMGFGLPVVATIVGGIPDLIEDGVNGLLVTPRNPHGLAEALRNLISDPTLRRDIGRRNFSKAQSFTVERVSENMINFISSAADQRYARSSADT